jgi:2-iminobutanoate/2-iminopropanoate deaminase
MKKIIKSKKAPAPIGPYNQAVIHNKVLYVSGQIALKDGEMIQDSIADESKVVMDNAAYILEAAGLSFKDVIKCSIFLTDMAHFPEVNEVYGRYFEEGSAPARECIAVKALPKGARVEISLIADCEG